MKGIESDHRLTLAVGVEELSVCTKNGSSSIEHNWHEFRNWPVEQLPRFLSRQAVILL